MLRTVLAALGRIGLDFRSPLRHARDAAVHPVRTQLLSAVAGLHEELAREAAALHSALGEIAAERRSVECGLRTAAAAVQADQKDLRVDVVALQSQNEELKAQNEEWRAKHEDLRARSAAWLHGVEQSLAGLDERLAAERDERRLRIATLEKVIAAAPDLSPPAAGARSEARSPMVSIILPTRDRAHVICDAIASVKAQSFADWELIIVDDGSSDDTAIRIAPELADVRIRYVQRPAGGASAARNSGLGLARGSYVAYIDSDNIWYPDFLNAAVRMLAADPTCDLTYGVLVTDHHGLQGTCLLWLPFDRDRLLVANYIDMNVIVHRMSLVDRFGGFDETLDRLCDWDLVLRYTQQAPAHALPVLAARYRVCDDHRITNMFPHEPYMLAIQRKWSPPERHAELKARSEEGRHDETR